MALPETALTLGIALLLILGTAQMTIIGFSQVSADGAAFVAAHTTAIDSSANPATTVATAFPQLSADSVTATPAAVDLQQAVVSKTVGGFLALPGVAANYALTGADVEFTTSASTSPQPFAFGASAVLANYCPASGACVLPSTYSMYLAQSIDEQSNAQGWNGAFAEWRCHQQYYAALSSGSDQFPQSRPTTGLKNSVWDPNNPHGAEAPIYGWDVGNHACQ